MAINGRATTAEPQQLTRGELDAIQCDVRADGDQRAQRLLDHIRASARNTSFVHCKVESRSAGRRRA